MKAGENAKQLTTFYTCDANRFTATVCDFIHTFCRRDVLHNFGGSHEGV